jgi:Protein of unknown function (DUF3617)
LLTPDILAISFDRCDRTQSVGALLGLASNRYHGATWGRGVAHCSSGVEVARWRRGVRVWVAGQGEFLVGGAARRATIRLRTCRAFPSESAVRKILITCLMAAAALEVLAAGIGLKPGLWEVRVVKQVIDGRDMSAQIAQSATRMEQAMANLPPEQRARLEAMLKQRGIGQDGNGSYRVCITPQMAKRDAPVLDKEGRCKPIKLSHHGDRTSFAFDCSSGRMTTKGKGVATISDELVTTQVDATTQSAQGETHVMHSESEMKYVGPDCGDVKPNAER